MSGPIEQEVVIKANPARVYAALTDAKQFSAFTGDPAQIGAEAGDAFSGFGGMITGRNIELVPGKRLVQAWRAGNWPEGHYSVVRFELTPEGANTRLRLEQSGFPEEMRPHLEGGWPAKYWEPLKAYCER